MFTYDQLPATAQVKALEQATALSLKSEEWMHVLATAKLIKRYMVRFLERFDGQLPVGRVPLVTSEKEVTAIDGLSDFDMPASIRQAVMIMQDAHCESLTVEEAIRILKAECEDKIIAYWKSVFEQKDHTIEWIDNVDMIFTTEGDIAAYVDPIEGNHNYKLEWMLNGERTALNVETQFSLLTVAIPLVTIFHWVNKGENNLTIDDVMKLLIEYKRTGGIKTAQGMATSHPTGILNTAPAEPSNYSMIDMLGNVADCLAFSPNVDNFNNNELFDELYDLDDELARFLEYCQHLYMMDDVCDISSVKSHYPALFLELG